MRAFSLTGLVAATLIAVVAGSTPVAAQDDELPGRRGARPTSGQPAWFSLPMPPAPGTAPAVVVGKRGPRALTLPPGEPAAPELTGAAIRTDLEQLVAISKESRDSKEIGSGQIWGRISGFPSGAKTAAWAADQFRQAGIADVKVQSIAQEGAAGFWLPLSWEVKLLGDPAFGAGSTDVVLQSAMPLSPSDIPGGTLTAPIAYVGNGSPALSQIDVKGKIAVQLIVPQAHMVFERDSVVPQAQALIKRGAVAVFNLMRQPGNEYARDFSNCGGPCVNIGGHDGHFFENVIERAAVAGVADKLRAQITLKTQTFRNLKADNAVAVIPGSASDEVIVVDAHYDGWFEGAGDNGDGMSVLMGLARHFAKPENKPRRTLVFIASAGHHSPGINGPRGFIAANPALAAKALIMVNIEHVAQRNFNPSRNVAPDGYREAIADSGEAPITPGITNKSPFLNSLFDQGVLRYGVNFVSDQSSMQSGETGGFAAIKGAKLTIMQAPPLYHTTGEVLGVISTPGLERIARFFAYFIKEVDKAPANQINP
jgi:peptidase M28-like protein